MLGSPRGHGQGIRCYSLDADTGLEAPPGHFAVASVLSGKMNRRAIVQTLGDGFVDALLTNGIKTACCKNDRTGVLRPGRLQGQKRLGSSRQCSQASRVRPTVPR